MKYKTLKLNLKENSYNIIIGKSLIANADKFFNLKRKVLIVTDDNIPKKFLQKVKKCIVSPHIFILKHGEKNKNYSNYLKIINELIKYNFDRSSAIVAIGGGMVGDISAFAASTYMRGIDFYNIPTTLLSQVDSSIGGKTAINLSSIKNIIGTFSQPKGVLIDIDTLSTLPRREFASGLAESIKMAATFDEKFFNYLEKCSNITKNIEYIIFKSLNIKKKVVEKDEKEKGLRKVLNFGHTIGHAVEKSKNYKLLHGECVGIGMNYFSNGNAKQRIISLLQKYNLPTKTNIDKNKVIDLISHDKKQNKSSISTIQVDNIGKYKIVDLTLKEINNLL